MAEGIRPLPGRVAATKDHPRPSTVKQLQAFLGSGEFLPPFCAGSDQDFAATHGLIEGWSEGRRGCVVDVGDGEGIF
jgi:hypothetical protein